MGKTTMAISDTDPAAERVLIQPLQQVPVWRKMQMLGDLNQTARRLALAGLRARFPEASELELQRRLVDLLLGPELAKRAYGPYEF